MIEALNKPKTDAAVLKEVKLIVGRIKGLHYTRVANNKGLWEYGLDIVDLVDVILAIEQKYNIIIPDDVPVYTVNDFVAYIQLNRPQVEHQPAAM
ncbi:acyl carrier protein [Pontibacter beigongshangensis]|uniref:acyl carrier protein n=1 Tax=Pontibacter beigongshangensis TaxID=2574733 RepID=UPI00164F10EA|nr:acyl carrier protein [Pontibacter beigongshangensis]